jgi:hypothetical protein
VAARLRFIVSALCLLFVAARASAQEPALAWTLRVPDARADAPFLQSLGNPRCVAVVTATTVHVVSMSGERLWSWNYRRSSRFLKTRLPLAYEPMALSPMCDRVAMAGDSGYRYVWVAGRDIEAQAFQTVGTPLAVAFDISGEYLAVSTGASRGYLMTRTLEPHWIGHLRDFPIRWPEQELAAPARTALVDFSESDVDRLLGVPPWGAWVSDSVSTDGQWRVVIQSPWDRRDLWQMLVLYGPEGHAFHGRWKTFSQRARPRWSKPMGCLNAVITIDGEFIIASGDPKHPDHAFGNAGALECIEPGALTTFVFDRNGSVLFSRGGEFSDPDLAEAFRQKTGRSLPPMPAFDHYSEACEQARDGVTPVCLAGPNGLVVTSQGNEIRAVRRR